ARGFRARPAHRLWHTRAGALVALPARTVGVGRQELRAVAALRLRALLLLRGDGRGVQGAGPAPDARNARRPGGVRDLPGRQRASRREPLPRPGQRRGDPAGRRLSGGLGCGGIRRRPPRPSPPGPQRERPPPHAPAREPRL
ncbi:MAG: hypothetical protein AVDCRST_MAG03-2658, partial [uncultured Rubrobacteraceae bacterium]